MPVLNEEENLSAGLASVAWADEIVVVDSHSTDATAEIAEALGARVVQFEYNDPKVKKKTWALRYLELRNDWVFLLDADERVTPELGAEIARAIANDGPDGYLVDREFIFMDRSLRCFRPNWNLRLFRRGRGHIEDLGLHDLPGTGDNEIHEHVVVDGPVGLLQSPLLHDDYRGITPWLDRHNRYATWEAHLYGKLRAEPLLPVLRQLRTANPLARKRALRLLWVRLPYRPPLRFLVWYFARRGFLDGRAGFIFCVLMAYYELTINIKLRELEAAQ